MPTADELLTSATALWTATRRGYRDNMVKVGQLLRDFVCARLTEGDGRCELARRQTGCSRECATKDAAQALGTGVAKINELIRVAAVVELFFPNGPGALSFSSLRSMRTLICRPNRGTPIARNKGGTDGTAPSMLEVWAVRPQFRESAPALIADALANNWRDCDVSDAIARLMKPIRETVKIVPDVPTGDGYDPDAHMSTGQIARLCQVAPRTVGGWIDSGKLTGFRLPPGIGRGGAPDSHRRVRVADLYRFAAESGIPLPLPNASYGYALDSSDRVPATVITDPMEFGAVVASKIVTRVFIGDCDGLAALVRATAFVFARHPAATVVLVLDASISEAPVIDVPPHAKLLVGRRPLNLFELGAA